MIGSGKKKYQSFGKIGKVGVEIAVEPLKAKSLKLKAQTFVLTGTLESMSREQAKEKIRALGGDVNESVSKILLLSWRARNLVLNMIKQKIRGKNFGREGVFSIIDKIV